jgi:hypothetical protein
MSEERKALQNLEAVLWLACCNGQANPDINWLKCKVLHQNAYSKLEILERAAYIGIQHIFNVRDTAGLSSAQALPKTGEVIREQPSEADMARMQETSINAVNLTPPGKNCVLVFLDNLIVAYMNDDEMKDFQKYMQKIREVQPEAEQIKDCLWQHWTSIRRAFWNENKVYVSSEFAT